MPGGRSNFRSPSRQRSRPEISNRTVVRLRSLELSLRLIAPFATRRDGGTGRRSGLKIRRYLVPWGFNSPSRHQANSSRYIYFIAASR